MRRRAAPRFVLALLAFVSAFAAPATAVAHGLAHEAAHAVATAVGHDAAHETAHDAAHEHDAPPPPQPTSPGSPAAVPPRADVAAPAPASGTDHALLHAVVMVVRQADRAPLPPLAPPIAAGVYVATVTTDRQRLAMPHGAAVPHASPHVPPAAQPRAPPLG